jgi:hypothetical protein
VTTTASATPASSYTGANVAPDAFLFGNHVSEVPSTQPASSYTQEVLPLSNPQEAHAAALLGAQTEGGAQPAADVAHATTLDHVTMAILQHYQTDHFLA